MITTVSTGASTEVKKQEQNENVFIVRSHPDNSNIRYLTVKRFCVFPDGCSYDLDLNDSDSTVGVIIPIQLLEL